MTSDISLTFSGDMVLLARVAEAGSISAACRQVGLERTTVSRRLSRLENRLGADLLNRSNREVTLTDAGVLYYQFCQKVVEAVEDGFQELTSINVSPKRLLRIELSIPDATQFISMVSETFVSERIEYRLGNSEQPMSDPDCDLCIQLRFQNEPSQDAVIKLAAVSQSLWISSAYAREKGSPMSLDILQEMPFIYAAQQPLDKGLTFERANKTRVVPVGPKFRVPTLEQCRELCLLGNGAVLLPDYLCRPYVDSGQLQKVDAGWVVHGANLVAVHARNKFLNRSARLHLDYLRNQIGKLQHH